MNEIPEKWFQSFEKQKKEYQMLLKDRTKLEKDRNNLIIELVKRKIIRNINK